MKRGTANPRQRGQGFSLIEVAIAMGLLAVAGLGSISLMTGMMRANRDARLRTEAATLAKTTIDTLISATEIASTPAMMVDGLVESGFCDGSAASCTVGPEDFGALKRTVILGPTADGIMPVRIRIGWERTAGTNTLQFAFFLVEPR